MEELMKLTDEKDELETDELEKDEVENKRMSFRIDMQIC